MSLVSKDSIIKACADAFKEGTGAESVKVGELAAGILAAIGDGSGGLPSGWATGQFNTTPATMYGEFEIDHGLGAVPNVVMIFCENKALAGYVVKGVLRLNYLEEYVEEEDLYYPAISSGRMIYCNSGGTNLMQAGDSGVGLDTDRTIHIPKGGANVMYLPAFTYRWLAIRLEV